MHIGKVWIPVSKQKHFIHINALILSAILSFAIRLFSVIRYESVIHEFDPYFNFRSTRMLAENDFKDFINWFDDRAWYPLGRAVGPTIYPGLMVTANLLHRFLNYIRLPISIKDVCVFFSPIFSAFTTIACYMLTSEVSESTGASLLASAIVSILPGYISRSVAGSYDNEGIAIFVMVLTYFLWVRSVRTGSLYWSVLCALSYFYMVSAWGGYVFIMNLIPLYVFILIIVGRFNTKVYIAYSVFYTIGTLLSMQIPFVSFQPVQSSEHMTAFGVFGLIQIVALVSYLRSRISSSKILLLFKSLFSAIFILLFIVFIVITVQGKISPWTGRFYALLDPSYAKNHIPIIASVSEHQPTAWSSFFLDFYIMLLFFPLGCYYCFKDLNDVNIFLLTYSMTSLYFAGVMVRLILVLAPAVAIMSAIGVSRLTNLYMRILKEEKSTGVTSVRSSYHRSLKDSYSYKSETAVAVLSILAFFFLSYVKHCIWVTSVAYSSPSIVLSSQRANGELMILDDFREAYWWLRQNTPENARVMSWWDYGYQIGAIANRTTLVDNNTWNNTHISRVGQAMSSSETVANEIIRELDVDYVLIIFGGLVGFAGDDISKFLWMVRIGGSTEKGKHINENDYFTISGQFRIDKEATPVLRNCLLYKLSYFRFGELQIGNSIGFDRVRNSEIGFKNISLTYLEEAFTSEHWIVRIYKVKDISNRS